MRFLTVATVFVLTITACSNRNPNTNSAPSTSDTAAAEPNTATPVPRQTKTIDDEAQDYVKTFWDKRVARCDGSFFWVSRGKGRLPKDQQFFQCRTEPVATIFDGEEIPERELSDADKLKGVDPRPIDWDGKGTFTYRTCRLSWGGTQNWEPWKDADELKFRLRRVKGSWAIDEITPNDINVHDVYEIDCTFVKKYLQNKGLSQ